MPRPSLSSFLRLMDVRTIASPIKQSPTPSPLTMAGPAQDKGRPDTSGHKRPSVKKNREGCFMALRIFWSKPDPSHPQLLSGHGEKMWDFWNGSRFNGLSPHLEKSHYSWNFLLLKESLPSYVFIFRNWQSIVFHEKKNSGSKDWWRGRGESHQRRYNLVILRMFEIQAPDYWTFILLAGLVTRLSTLPLPFPIQPFLYFRLEAILQISHMALRGALLLYFSAYSVIFSEVSFHFCPELWIMLSLIPSITGQVPLTESLTNKQNPFNPDLLLFFLGTDVFGMPLNKLPNKTNKVMGLRRVSMWRIDPKCGVRSGDPPGWTKILIMTSAPFGQPPSRQKWCGVGTRNWRTINCKIINTRQNVVN